ncbi:unnamed protein product [Lactuca virosa]|uniref:Uncharacterized protein n=1 Tax=Lactuca virosa TaxID=75947 RepID=A0AAU9MT10_9ASTR|nr:unnamed protein product [Lactuca virosa]
MYNISTEKSTKEMKPVTTTHGFGLRKGAWTAHEDTLLKKCIEKYGEGKWHLVALRAGLSRCRKSCRLRWLNYLRPNIKRGNFGEDEVDLILRLHKLLGNRWSLIAGRIPGRTANDVKNYWNTNIHPRSKQQKKKSSDAKPMQHITTTVIKPKPLAFSNTLNHCMDDNPQIMAHGECSLIRTSNDDDNNNCDISFGLTSSPTVLDDKGKEYLDDLFDDIEMEDGKFGWLFGGSPVAGQELNVVEQEDGQNDQLLEFPMDEVAWKLID